MMVMWRHCNVLPPFQGHHDNRRRSAATGSSVDVAISESMRIVAEVNDLVRSKDRPGRITSGTSSWKPEIPLPELVIDDDKDQIDDKLSPLGPFQSADTQAVHFGENVVDEREHIPWGQDENREELMSPEYYNKPVDTETFHNEAAKYLRKRLSSRPTTAPNTVAPLKLGPGFKHRIHTRSFPKNAPGTPASFEDELAVDGNSLSSKDKRMRSAGKVPQRAKSSGPAAMLQKQQEMLRKAPVRAMNTAPSIPSPYGEFGTRSPRNRTFMAELEPHARKVNSPRMYMERGQFCLYHITSYRIILHITSYHIISYHI